MQRRLSCRCLGPTRQRRWKAVRQRGGVLDKRDVAAAKGFFRKALKGQQRAPQTIALDGYAASHRAVRELKADGLLSAGTKLRSSKYLNDLIEQDHRSVKQRIAGRSRPSCACSLERGAWDLTSARRRRQRLLVTTICT